VAVLGLPIGVINALRVTAIATGTIATVQALIPTVQLRVPIIVGASVTDCGNRQHHDIEHNKRCMPKVTVHLTPNPESLRPRFFDFGYGREGLYINSNDNHHVITLARGLRISFKQSAALTGGQMSRFIT
jgi:hypothetical protein